MLLAGEHAGIGGGKQKRLKRVFFFCLFIYKIFKRIFFPRKVERDDLLILHSNWIAENFAVSFPGINEQIL